MNPIRIRLRYADLDTFVERFAPNVTRGGVFLASRNIQAVGAIIPFEIQLSGGDVVLAGQGRVTWVKEFDPAEPHRPYGMGVQFVSIDPAAKPILARILRAKEARGQGRRTATAPLVPLGSGAGGVFASPHARVGVANGKTAVPPIDTSVDLAAEYGLDDQTVRRMVERTWMTGARTNDDLADLLKPEPPETVTLQQALAELPRLLDPQYSRRRASSGFRPLDTRGAGGEVGNAAPETTSVEPSSVAPSSVEAPIVLSAGEAAEAAEAGGGTDEAAATGESAIVIQTTDLSDTTDMTGDRDPVDSMQAVPAQEMRDPDNSSNGHLGPGRRQ